PIGSEQEIMIDGKQGSVLVDVIKLVDAPERVVPALVWFQLVNGLDSFWKHSLCFGSLAGFVFLGSLCNGKFHLSKLLLGQMHNRSPIHSDDHQLTCEVVKSGTNVVDDISSHRDSVEGQGRNLLEFVGMKQGYGMGSDTRIWIGREDCRVFEGKNLGC